MSPLLEKYAVRVRRTHLSSGCGLFTQGKVLTDKLRAESGELSQMVKVSDTSDGSLRELLTHFIFLFFKFYPVLRRLQTAIRNSDNGMTLPSPALQDGGDECDAVRLPA